MTASSINTSIQVGKNSPSTNKNTQSENNSNNLRNIFVRVLTKVETIRGNRSSNSSKKDDSAGINDTNKYLSLLMSLMRSSANNSGSQEVSMTASRQTGNPQETLQNINVEALGRIS